VDGVRTPFSIEREKYPSREVDAPRRRRGTGNGKWHTVKAVHVAAAIRGGASLVHGVQMRKIVEKLSM
jgi:hypothetical protein